MAKEVHDEDSDAQGRNAPKTIKAWHDTESFRWEGTDASEENAQAVPRNLEKPDHGWNHLGSLQNSPKVSGT